MTQEEHTEAARAMTDSWKFYLKYEAKVPLSNSDWDMCIAESKEIWDRYHRNPLISDMIVCYIADIERRDKNT